MTSVRRKSQKALALFSRSFSMIGGQTSQCMSQQLHLLSENDKAEALPLVLGVRHDANGEMKGPVTICLIT